MNRRDFLQTSTILGVTGLIGGSALLSSCSSKPNVTPLREAGTYYIPDSLYEIGDDALSNIEDLDIAENNNPYYYC